jgi:hypothetical protein
MTQDDIRQSVIDAFQDFYVNHLVQTVDGTIQIFESFTYGEMVISLLLFCILLVMVFKWIWEVFKL